VFGDCSVYTVTLKVQIGEFRAYLGKEHFERTP
jgi:hypothetical protein